VIEDAGELHLSNRCRRY